MNIQPKKVKMSKQLKDILATPEGRKNLSEAMDKTTGVPHEFKVGDKVYTVTVGLKLV